MRDGRISGIARQPMEPARHGSRLHSLHPEVLRHLGGKRAMRELKDLFLQDQKVVPNTNEVRARVLRIGKVSCPIHLAVTNLQHLEEVTSLNETSQMLLRIYPLEIHSRLCKMLDQIP